MNTQMKYYFANCMAIGALLTLVFASVIASSFYTQSSVDNAHKRVDSHGKTMPDTQMGQYLASRFANSHHYISHSIDYLLPLEDQKLPVSAFHDALMNYLYVGRFRDSIRMAQRIQDSHGDFTSHQMVDDYVSYGYRVPAPMILASHALAMGHYDDVVKVLNHEPATLIDNIVYMFLKSWAYAGQNNAKDAFLTITPYYDSPEIGQLARLQGSYIADYLGDYQHAYDILQGIDTPSIDVYMQNLMMLIQLQHWEQGRSLLFDVQNMGVNVPEPIVMALTDGKPMENDILKPNERISRVFLELSHSLSQSNPQLALVYAQLSILVFETQGQSPAMVSYVAGLLGETGALTDAIEKLKKVSLDNQDALSIVIQLIELYEKQENYESALQILNDLETTYGCEPAIWEAKGDIFGKQKKYVLARDAYTQSIDCLTDANDTSAWILYFKRADTYASMKDWDAMEPDLLYAQSLSPENSVLLNYLGYTWIERGKNTDKALDMVKRSLELNPNSGAAIDSLGWAYYKLGRYEEAVKMLEQSAKIETTDPVVTDHLGDAYWQVGREREARYQWQRVLDLHAHDSHVADVVDSVRKKLKNGLLDN